jgi:hypothetical protein
MKLKVLLLHLVIERNQEQGLSFSLSKQMPEDNCGQYTAKCSRACIATDVFSCPIVEGHSRPLSTEMGLCGDWHSMKKTVAW